jgi:hypothetical protein
MDWGEIEGLTIVARTTVIKSQAVVFPINSFPIAESRRTHGMAFGGGLIVAMLQPQSDHPMVIMALPKEVGFSWIS